MSKKKDAINLSEEDVNTMLVRIALDKGTTVAHVRREMEAAIDAAMRGDEATRANMTALIGHDDRPTLRELLSSIASATKEKMDRKE